jgi:serine/threonine-protein kinase
MCGTLRLLDTALEGRYRIERQLGEGGMATVYLAEDLKHERQVAIKVLKPELAAVIGGERFLAEIRTTANLQHPHILPLFDSGEADGFLFYVMPLLEGHSLRERLANERQLPVQEALAIAKAVAGALDYAHRRGVIHRDIKPANILLHDGQPIVADFGIALAVSAAGGDRMTETGLSLGTPGYMSPEQATADHDPGPQSDIYSLGCVLYEMLTGEPPFTGPSTQAILGKLIMGNPTLPTEHRPAVPVHVEAAVLQALEKLPADRFQSAAAFSEALDNTGLWHPRQSGATGPRAEKSWLSQRASQVALAVALVALAWAGYSTFTRPEPEPRPVIRDQLGDLGADYPMFLALSPNGRFLGWKALNTQRFYLRRLDSEEVLSLGPPQLGHVAAFSPDSRWLLAHMGSQGGMVRVSVGDGRVSRILDDSSGGGPMDWTEDGILYRSSDSIMLLDSVGGTAARVTDAEPDGERLGDAVLIPGGRYLLYHTGVPLEESEIRVYDTRTGDRRTLVSRGVSPSFVPPDHLFFLTADRTLHAVPFDPATATLEGQPYPVQDSVFIREGSYIQTAYDVSESGDAVFLIGGVDVLSERRRMVRVNPDGTETPLSLPPGEIGGGRLAPDGRTLAYTRDDRIHIFDPILSLDEPIPNETDDFSPVDAFDPTWDPSGERLAYVARGPGRLELMVYRLGDDEPVRIPMSVPYSWLAPVAWTPDGEGLVLNVEHREGDEWEWDVVIAHLGTDTAVVEPYLPGVWNDRGGALSPDGDWLVYRSDEGGPGHLYARSFPEPGPAIEVLPPDPEEGRQLRGQPMWSPEGDAIYWHTESAMMATEVTLGATLEVGETRQILAGEFWGFELAPDGNFIVTRPVTDGVEVADASPPRLIHVSNFLRHVRSLRDGGN